MARWSENETGFGSNDDASSDDASSDADTTCSIKSPQPAANTCTFIQACSQTRVCLQMRRAWAAQHRGLHSSRPIIPRLALCRAGMSVEAERRSKLEGWADKFEKVIEQPTL